MTKPALRGVIAAIATAVDEDGEPDCGRATALAHFLLSNGCDGLNVLGTTGEATSFSLAQRKAVMNAYRTAGLPLEVMMVGTGASATADAVELTRHHARQRDSFVFGSLRRNTHGARLDAIDHH